MRRWIAAVTTVSLLASCGEQSGPESADNAPGEILTTFYPTTYLAQRIAGEHATIINPIPADEDPIFYVPSPELIARYQDAELVIINGAEFEKWAMAAPLPRSRVVDTADAFSDRFIYYEEGTTHSHGDGEHTHKGTDGHTWLDPLNAIEQARAIRDALKESDPARAADFDAGFESLEADLNALHTRLEEITPSLEAADLYASHPAYNYLAARYGWSITNFDLDPEDVEGSIETVAGAFDAPGDRPRLLLWESAPADGIAEQIEAQFGITSIVFSPAETREEGDPEYLTVMRANLDALADAAR